MYSSKSNNKHYQKNNLKWLILANKIYSPVVSVFLERFGWAFVLKCK